MRSRTFVFRIYADSETYDCEDLIQKLDTFHYIGIKHDKEDCKDHYHFVIRVDNPTTISAICKWLSLCPDDNGKAFHLDVSSSYEQALRYLVHSEGKTEYKVEECICNDEELYKKLCFLTSNKAPLVVDDESGCTIIINEITSGNIATTLELFQFCLANGLLSNMNKFKSLYIQILKEMF